MDDTFLQLDLVGVCFIVNLAPTLQVRRVLRSSLVWSLCFGCKSGYRKGRGIAGVVFAL